MSEAMDVNTPEELASADKGRSDEEITAAINALGVDCTVIKGDIADRGLPEQFEAAARCFADFDRPHHAFLGNHDYLGGREVDGYALLGQEPAPRAVELGRWRLLLLETAIPGQHEGALEDDRLEWIEHEGERIPWKIDPFWDLHPAFGDIVRDRRICDPLCSLYDGHEPRLFKDKYIIKPPGSHGNGKHQDHNWWQGFPHSCISVAVAIDAADRENGCTQLWPGSHHHGFLHQAGTLDGAIPPEFTADEPFHLETEPGDIALFSCFTIHAAGPNQSDRFRRQLFLTYNDSRHGEHYFSHPEHFWNYRSRRYSDRGDDLYFI